MKKTIISLVFCLCSSISFAQTITIDSIPFTLDKKLLVFKASINGVAFDFAFDTGATIGLSNASVQSQTGLIVKKGSQTITDANLKKLKINNTVIKQMQIGSHQFENVKGAIYDMEFLTCHQLYLLGMDVIGQLNWKIDFKKQLIYVSKQPFTISDTNIEIPVSNATHRPKTSLTIHGINYPNCLIDLGYTGYIEIPENPALNLLHQQLFGTNKTAIGLNSNMSVAGLGKPDTVKTILVDQVSMGQLNLQNAFCTISEKTDFKIGIGFFSSQSTEMILNCTAGKYYISPNESKSSLPLTLDARVSYQNGHLVVTSLNLNQNSTSKLLSIGEIVNSINGKKATDFNDNCQFLLEFYHTKIASIQIEKLDGRILTIGRSALL